MWRGVGRVVVRLGVRARSGLNVDWEVDAGIGRGMVNCQLLTRIGCIDQVRPYRGSADPKGAGRMRRAVRLWLMVAGAGTVCAVLAVVLLTHVTAVSHQYEGVLAGTVRQSEEARV